MEDIEDMVIQIDLFLASECLEVKTIKDNDLAREAKEAFSAANQLGKRVFDLAKAAQDRTSNTNQSKRKKRALSRQYYERLLKRFKRSTDDSTVSAILNNPLLVFFNSVVSQEQVIIQPETRSSPASFKSFPSI